MKQLIIVFGVLLLALLVTSQDPEEIVQAEIPPDKDQGQFEILNYDLLGDRTQISADGTSSSGAGQPPVRPMPSGQPPKDVSVNDDEIAEDEEIEEMLLMMEQRGDTRRHRHRGWRHRHHHDHHKRRHPHDHKRYRHHRGRSDRKHMKHRSWRRMHESGRDKHHRLRRRHGDSRGLPHHHRRHHHHTRWEDYKRPQPDTTTTFTTTTGTG